MRVLASNLVLREAATRAVHALCQAGIKVIVYKGQDYIDRVYRGDLNARPMADVDMLIARIDLDSAISALQQAGFVFESRNPRFEHELLFKGFGASVDLHLELLQPVRANINHRDVFERAAPMSSIPGAWQTEINDAVLMHCIGQTIKGFYLPPYSYVELQHLLEKADGPTLIKRASQWRVCRTLYCAMRVLAHKGVVQAKVIYPEVAVSAPVKTILDNSVVDFAVRTPFAGPVSNQRLRWLRLLLVDRLQDAVRYVGSRMMVELQCQLATTKR